MPVSPLQSDGMLVGARSAGKSRARNRKGILAQIFNPVGKPPSFKVPKMDNKPFKVLQTYVVGSPLLSSVTVPTFAAFNFQVASLDQVSTLQALFDQYRILWVEVWLTPRVASPSTNANSGLFATVVDYDDSTSLSTFAQALDYENVQVASGFDGQYRKFRPHAAVSAYSGTFGSFMNMESPWLDAVSTTVQHYGMKTAWTVTDIVYAFDMIVRLTTEWKNLR